jgi:hypothetical protein
MRPQMATTATMPSTRRMMAQCGKAASPSLDWMPCPGDVDVIVVIWLIVVVAKTPDEDDEADGVSVAVGTLLELDGDRVARTESANVVSAAQQGDEFKL